jgi:hypothetical protein
VNRQISIFPHYSMSTMGWCRSMSLVILSSSHHLSPLICSIQLVLLTIARARTALRLDYREDWSQAYEDLGLCYSLTWQSWANPKTSKHVQIVIRWPGHTFFFKKIIIIYFYFFLLKKNDAKGGMVVGLDSLILSKTENKPTAVNPDRLPTASFSTTV